MADSTNRLRLGRFLFSCGIIFFVFHGIFGLSVELDVEPFFGFAVLGGYLLAVAILMATIVGRLYDQHELRRFRFDLKNTFLLTTLIALPLGFANFLWHLYSPNLPEVDGPNRQTALLIGFVVAVFLMLPTLFISEAILVWALWLRKRVSG